MKTVLNQLMDIREGEHRRTALMFLYFFLVVTSFYILKPVRSSLFLEKLGSARLPYVYLGTTALIALVVPFYSKFALRLPKPRLTTISMLVLSLNLVVFRWLLIYEWAGIAAAFYIWVNLFSTVTISQFWLFANFRFNPREAKRLFGFIGSGGILGGIAGGSFARWAAPFIGTENLLWACVLPLIGCVAIVNRIETPVHAPEREKARAQDQEIPPSEKGSLALIWESRYFKWLALILGLATVVSTLIDYQFNVIAEQRFPGKEAKTAFFGNFFAGLNACVFLFQLFLTSRILKRLGIGVSLLLLPSALVLSSIATLAFPVLWAVVFSKGADWGLRYSVDQSTRELLYLPIPDAIKSKIKPWIDMLGSRLAEGIAAGLLLMLTVWFSFSLRAISLAAIGFIALWGLAVFAIKKEYLKLLVRLLERKAPDVQSHFISAMDASTIRMLFSALNDPDERRVLYALELLEMAKGVDLRPALKPLLNHPSKAVQVKALRILFETRDSGLVDDVEKLVRSEAIEVQTEAISYVCVYGGDNAMERMKAFLSDSNPYVRAATLVCAARQVALSPDSIGGDEELLRMVHDQFAEMTGNKSPNRLDVRATVAREFRSIDAADFLPYLIELLNDESPQVVNQAIVSAGHLKKQALIPILLEKLKEKATRLEAQAALAASGDAIVPDLKAALMNPEMEASIRKRIPRVLSLIGTQKAVDALIESLLKFWSAPREFHDAALRYHVIKALNRLRRDQPSLKFPGEPIRAAIHFEAQNHARILGWLHACRTLTPDSLLMLALKEKLVQSLERLFRTLGLIYPSQEVYNAYSPLHQQLTRSNSSDVAVQHAASLLPNALEFLDNLLEPEIKRVILPLIDDTPIETRLEHADALWEQKVMTLEEGFAELMKGSDSWLRACAIYTVGQMGFAHFFEMTKAFQSASEVTVRAAAEFVQHRWAAPSTEKKERPDAIGTYQNGRTDEVNLLEKVAFLKRAEIFADIPTEQLAFLAAVAQEVYFEGRSVIFKQNESADAVYIVIKGNVQLSGERGLSETVQEGNVFGMLALFTNEPRLLTAVALENTHVLKIEREVFFDLLSDYVEIPLGLLKRMVQTIKALSAQLNLQSRHHQEGQTANVRPVLL